jgi:uncharacterized protein HemX
MENSVASRHATDERTQVRHPLPAGAALLAAIQAGFGDWALSAANAVRQAQSKAIVASANGDPTQYQEMAKSGTRLKMIVADGHEFVAQLP